MREIALLLVLANLAVLAWDRWITPDGPAARAAPASALPSDLPKLVLATEPAARSEGAAAASRGSGGADMPAAVGAGDSGATPSGESEAPSDADAPAQTAEPQTTSLITHEVPADVRTAVPTGSAGAADTATDARPASVETVALLAATPTPRCVSIGPYLDLAETAEAAARLRERGHMPSQRIADSQLWVGNWVYLPPFKTRGEAVAAVEKLRGEGVDDLYVESGGDDENAVSLGLYSDHDRAQALADAIQKLGYTPRISDKYRMASVYWVDVVLPPNATLDASKYQVRSGRGAVRAEEHGCPDGTAMPGVVADTNADDQ